MASLLFKARPLAGALGIVPFLKWQCQPTACEETKKPTFQPAKCVKNEAHTHNTRLITLQLDSAWTQRGPIANVVVKANIASAPETGCCACCKCPPPCGCPKTANGCCACCKCPGTCGCPKKETPAATAEGCCACCKCPPPCGCPKTANGCCACCKCPDTCACPKTEVATKAEGCCACCKCPPPCSCPKTENGCCACCKCPGTCGCPKKEAPTSSSVARPYNPLSTDSGDKVTILVKRYENAKMGTALHTLKEGDSVEVRGPNQQWAWTKGQHKEYGLVAGGTGITPLFQAAEHILKHDAANVTLATFNRTPSDVLLKKELAELAARYPGRLSTTHFVEGGDGYQQAGCEQAGRCCMPRVLKKTMPAAGEGVFILVCGPKDMTAHVAGPKTEDFKQGEVDGVLKGLGYESKHIWKV